MLLMKIKISGDYIRGDRGAVSEGMIMDQTIRENMSKNRPKIPGKCHIFNQYDRVKVLPCVLGVLFRYRD